MRKGGIVSLLVLRAYFEWQKSLGDLLFIVTGIPFALFWVRRRRHIQTDNAAI
jgi:hypothetical protein